jgi:hypothetical protein
MKFDIFIRYPCLSASLWIIDPGPSGNLILILFGRFENAAFHIPFSSENPFLKISSSHFLASF